jgi:hypothetical protein
MLGSVERHVGTGHGAEMNPGPMDETRDGAARRATNGPAIASDDRLSVLCPGS